eukprot:m51a1_g3926 hypothetical protein (478) ;mRNA; f:190625-192297
MHPCFACAFVLLTASAVVLASDEDCRDKLEDLTQCITSFSKFGDIQPDKVDSSALDQLCNPNDACSAPNVVKQLHGLIKACDRETMKAAGMDALVASAGAMLELPCAKSSNGQYCLLSAASIGSTFNNTSVDIKPALDTFCDRKCLDEYKQMGALASQFKMPTVPGMPSMPDVDFSQLFAVYTVFPAMCEREGNNYCMADLRSAAPKIESGDMEAAADLVCSDCFRRMGARVASLVGSKDAMPTFGRACQKSPKGELCLRLVSKSMKSLNFEAACDFGPEKDSNVTACFDAVSKLAGEVGCCAASLLPFVEDAFGHLPAEAKSQAAKLFGEVCKPSVSDKAVIRFRLDNVDWSAITDDWSSLEVKVKADIAVSIGIETSEVARVYIDGRRRSDPSIVAEVAPASTSYTALEVTNYAKTAIDGGLSIPALSAGKYLDDPSKPATVSSGDAAINDLPRDAASGVAVAAGVVAAAMALHF